MLKNAPYRPGLLPVMLDLYNRLAPNLRAELNEFAAELAQALRVEGAEATASPVACTEKEIRAAHDQLLANGAELLVIVHATYAPSGVLAETLTETPLPVLLWPAQTLARLEPDQYDEQAMMRNHGVHGTQDLANVLRRRGRAFGVIHGHHAEATFLASWRAWLAAGRGVRAFRTANPVQLGGPFEQMLDLQTDPADAVTQLGPHMQSVSLDELAERIGLADEAQVAQTMKRYRTDFDISDDLGDEPLRQGARGELALRAILDERDSRALGLNFLPLCNDPRIGGALHAPASVLMSEGYGYAGEGDWLTASFVHAMQAAFKDVSFSEIFSVGYEDHRLVLKHWGEGNPALARRKPQLLPSACRDTREATFAIMDFEFRPGRAGLVNLSVDQNGQGQLLFIPGCVEDDSLPKVTGPRAVFRPDAPNVVDVLDCYARRGGSHHLALVYDPSDGILTRMADLAGWTYERI